MDIGADDYIAKPFRPKELVSRIRSVLRRCGKKEKILSLGLIRLDTIRGTVEKNGSELILSALEYRLLLIFLNHKGVVLTRNKLLEELWDIAGDFVNDNTLTVYIKQIRQSRIVLHHVKFDQSKEQSLEFFLLFVSSDRSTRLKIQDRQLLYIHQKLVVV